MDQLSATSSTQWVQLNEKRHQKMQVEAYVFARNGMVHSSSHHEYLWEPIAPHVPLTRKIPYPNFHPHLTWMK